MATLRDTAASSSLGRKPTDDQVDTYGLTHSGKVRVQNQDHFLICSLRKRMEVHLTSIPDIDVMPENAERLGFLAMIADGVGGGTRGEEASRRALEAIGAYALQSMNCYYAADPKDEKAFTAALAEAAWRCHENILSRADQDAVGGGMATTLTLWLGVWPRAYLLQVGDSRYYLLRDGELTQVSRDQTVAQVLVDDGVFSRKEASKMRWAHVLSSAIGGSEATPVVTGIDQGWGYVHLLCSDGLTKHVSDDRIGERLRTMTSAKQVCEDLLQDALDDGGSDNVSIIVVRALK